MIDFNDLIPRSPTKTYPPQTGLIDFNDLIPTSQPIQQKQIPSVEPTAEDLEIYRRMGLKEYVSPSGKRYPLTKFDPEGAGYDYETLFPTGADPDKPLTHFADNIPPTGIPEITDPKDIAPQARITPEHPAPTDYLRTPTEYLYKQTEPISKVKTIPKEPQRLVAGKEPGFVQKRIFEPITRALGYEPYIGEYKVSESGKIIPKYDRTDKPFGSLKDIAEYYASHYISGRGIYAPDIITYIASGKPSLPAALAEEVDLTPTPKEQAIGKFIGFMGSARTLAPIGMSLRIPGVRPALSRILGLGLTGGGRSLIEQASEKITLGRPIRPKEAWREAGLWTAIGIATEGIGAVNKARWLRKYEQAVRKLEGARYDAKLKELTAAANSARRQMGVESAAKNTEAARQWGKRVSSLNDQIKSLQVMHKGETAFINRSVKELRTELTQETMSARDSATKALQRYIRHGYEYGIITDQEFAEMAAKARAGQKIVTPEPTTKAPGISRRLRHPIEEMRYQAEKAAAELAKPTEAKVIPTRAAQRLRTRAQQAVKRATQLEKGMDKFADKLLKKGSVSTSDLRKLNILYQKAAAAEMEAQALMKHLPESIRAPIEAAAAVETRTEPTPPSDLRVPEAEKPPTEKVREPAEHLVAMPRAKGAREIEPAKGETILIENPEEKGDYQKYEDFGTGILRRGNKLYHKASLKEIQKFSTVKNARKAAQTLAQEDIDFELEDVEKIKAQFQQWQKDKGDIEAYLTGAGEELKAKDFPEYMQAWFFKDRSTQFGKPRDVALANLKNFVSEVPEFALNPVLTYKEGYLVFSDGYRFKFVPDYFGINKEALVEGDKIRFDLENLGIKKPSAKKLKAAEIWTGEQPIMGRTTEKPIPVERRRKKVKPRKLTAAEETYERALTDIETGKRVEVPGGVTYKAVKEDDIRRVAELGRKAGRQAWTVERDILASQERGTAETKLDIPDAIKIIRDVFSAQPPTVAKVEKQEIIFENPVFAEERKDGTYYVECPECDESFDLDECPAPGGMAENIEICPNCNTELGVLEKPEPLEKHTANIKLPNKEIIEVTYQFVDYPKHKQHIYSFNWEFEKGRELLDDVHFEANYKDVLKAGGPEAFAEKRAKEAFKEAEPAKVVKDPDKYREVLNKKWGEEKFDKMWFELAEGGENERFSDIDARVSDLDEEGKFDSPEAKKLRIEMDSIVDAELEKREAKAKPEEPTEEPSLFVPPTARGKLSFEDLIPDVKHIKNVVVDTFRDWPKEIKKVGKDFWTEIMATAKEVLTPFRYKALRRTMLGAFRYKKAPAKVVGIELQDIRDVLTTAHELGHNLDWLLNHKSFPRSIVNRFDVVAKTLGKEIKERKLREELKKVSRLLRPDLWLAREGKGKTYVNRHTELMADFISGYILDPEQIKKLAPTMTALLNKRLSIEPKLRNLIQHLHDVRYEGPKEPPIARTIREQLRMPAKLKPLQLHVDLSNEDYVKQAEQLGIMAARQYKVLMDMAKRQAQRIDKLVPNKLRQTDLVVIAEKGEKNPWTGKTREEILKESPLTTNEKKALTLYRGYQELARQTVNKYLRGADIAEYIKFIEDYFLHTYQTPMTQKYRSAIAKWAKRSPQAKKRVLPDLATAVEIGLTPRAKTLSEGLKLWAGINYRVATNKAFLSELPKLTNENGESILQKPQDKPDWPTVDYWPIRKHYAIPIPGRGILLHEGRVAVDPKLKPFVDAMFGYMFTSRPAHVLAAVNAIEKAFQLTVFSAFHHVAEFFSTVGGVGKKVFGVWGKSAKPFEDTLRTKLAVHLPAVGPFYAGSQLKQTGEFMEDYLSHGGQTGYITGEGIGLIDNMLRDLRHYFERLMVSQKPLGKALWIPYLPVKTVQQAHHAWQRFLWGTIVENGKMFTYYDCVQDGLKWADKAHRKVQKEIDEVSEKALKAEARGDNKQAQKYNSQLEKLYGRKRDIPSVDRVKEMVAQYINNNYGGQEWLNTMFKNPKWRWTFFQIFRSWDWTYGQLKTPLYLTGRGLKARTKAERQLFRRRGRRHWLWYLLAVFGATEGLQYALNRKFTWQNEPGHRFDVDYTKVWRFKDELKSKLLGTPNWKERGDYARRYTVFGKAGREVLYWFREPLTEFGRKLSPIAQTIMEQFTGYNIGSDFAEPWKTQDLELYEELWERAKNIGEKVEPFSFRGNNAFLALPLRKGMTRWKAIRAYQDIYSAKAKIAYESKFNIALLKTGRIAVKPALLFANEEKLRKDIAEACKVNNVDAKKADETALAKVRSIYYGKLSRAANNREVKDCNKYARALIELGATPKTLIQSIKNRGFYLTPGGREIEIEAFQKAAKEYFEKKAQNK